MTSETFGIVMLGEALALMHAEVRIVLGQCRLYKVNTMSCTSVRAQSLTINSIRWI